MFDYLDSLSLEVFLKVYLGGMLLGYLVVLFLIVRDYYKD